MPKEWYPVESGMPVVSGFSGRQIVVHPKQFDRLVQMGIIDQKGNVLPPPEPAT